MPDNEKLDLSPQERADILGETDRLRSSVAFMGELAGKGKLNRDEAVVHLSLICQAHDSLAGLLGVDAVSTALSESNRLLQAANARIHELEQKLGSEISSTRPTNRNPSRSATGPWPYASPPASPTRS